MSSRLLGVHVGGARDRFWSHLYFAWLYLIAKPSHMGADMDGLAASYIVLQSALIDEGIKLPDRRCPLLSHYSGQW
jgi:hypothetical protein